MTDKWEERARGFRERCRVEIHGSPFDSRPQMAIVRNFDALLAAEFRAIDAEAREEGRREEREGCAQLCKDESSQWLELSTAGFNVAGRCAAAIRARGKE